jgi:hypothetical protein
VFVPLDSGKVKITLEFEYLKEQYNWNDYDWIYSDFAAGRTPPPRGLRLLDRHARQHDHGQRRQRSRRQCGAGTTTPTLAYATYINNKRTRPAICLPAYTSVERGAYVHQRRGQFIQDEAFNYTSRGAFKKRGRELLRHGGHAPFEWLDARYNYFKELRELLRRPGWRAPRRPYADGVHWNVGTGNRSGYYRYAQVHNVDAVFKFDLFGVKNKVLTGFQRSTRTSSTSAARPSRIIWAFLPGARNTVSNPDYAGTNVNLQSRWRAGEPGHPRPRRRHQARPPDLLNFDPDSSSIPTSSVYHQTTAMRSTATRSNRGHVPQLSGHPP